MVSTSYKYNMIGTSCFSNILNEKQHSWDALCSNLFQKKEGKRKILHSIHKKQKWNGINKV